ncbi:MAG: plastocyanin/azurin family copper-binding protein [Nitrososphaeraceae archaeon]
MNDKKFIMTSSDRKNSKVKDILPLIIIVSITLTIGGILFAAKLTPEQTITSFNPMTETSLKNDLRVIKTPTSGDNAFIYAINQVAERGLRIAQNDTTVKQIIGEQKGRALTIAAVQPAVLQDKNGKVSYSSVGQIIITSNWQYVDGKFYSNPAKFNALGNKTGESHQHIWNVFVDLDKRIVSGITEEPERVMKETLEPNFIFTGMNMFMPDTVKVKPGSVLTWFNNSNLPHNIVGIYKRNASGSQQIPVDSGIIQPNESWRYNFNDNGVFEYLCTIHSADGMKGTITLS